MRFAGMGSTWVMMLCSTTPALATGLLIPKDSSLPPLAIESHRVNVTIDNQVATTRVEQVFVNHTNRDLEARYVFPLPKGAAIRDFSMMIGGKRVSGELVEKKRARQIYQQIVSRMRDPGLLEYIGNDLFRVNVYPVPRNGRQKIELSYTQLLTQDAGLTSYVYPLRTGEKASQTLKDFSVGVQIESNVAIKSIYSPSHEMEITKKGDYRAVAGFELNRARLDRDFELFYTVSDKDFGLNLLTYRPDAKQDGYFMLLVSPKSRIRDADVIRRDVSFVFDTSGSMSGVKIEQAKRALRHCIGRLNSGDRFNVIRFSTDVESYSPTMVEATDENRSAVNGFIDGLTARGGTNIDQALARALEHETDVDRPHVVIFLTDGLPTIGVTDKDEIVKHVMARRRPSLRIFAFGVGRDVNTHLLDAISGQSGGVTEYVRDREDIEVKVSRFYDKASHPVLTNLTLEIEKVGVSRMYPRRLPDLYHGSQLVVLGRYTGTGHVSLALSGQVNKDAERFVYETTFPRRADDHAFIESLWANRKVGYLLDAIRQSGEQKELVDEIIALSKQYGIQTPYTSYLVIEENAPRPPVSVSSLPRINRLNLPSAPESRQTLHERARAFDDDTHRRRGVNSLTDTRTSRHATRRLRDRRAGARARQTVRELTRRSSALRSVNRSELQGRGVLSELDRAGIPRATDRNEQEGINLSALSTGIRGLGGDASGGSSSRLGQDLYFSLDALRAESGEAAVQAAEVLARLKQQVQVAKPAGGWAGYSAAVISKRIGTRTMIRTGDLWVDSRFTAKCETVKVKYGSAAYFALYDSHKELRELFKLGTRLVIVTASGKALIIDADGAEKLDASTVKSLFVASKRKTPSKP